MTTPTRRTQAERTAETRGRLIDAAIELIRCEGMSGATTRRLCEQAGVSQGAFSYHFPTRNDLIVAALESVADERIARYDIAFVDAPATFEGRMRFLTDLVWEDVVDRGFEVWMKAWVAAADDADLHAGLVPLERRVRRRIATLGRRVLTEGIEPAELAMAAEQRGLEAKDLDALVGLAVSAMTGIAFVVAFEPRSGGMSTRAASRQRKVLERLLLT